MNKKEIDQLLDDFLKELELVVAPEGKKLIICKDCSTVIMVGKRSCRVRCPKCARKAINDRCETNRKSYYTNKSPDGTVLMEAICPKCGVRHTIKTLPPSAKITPRVYCPECKGYCTGKHKIDPVIDSYGVGFY